MATETSPFKASAEACVENAKKLIETADDLLWMEHLGPACALAITAQEELAKAFLLNLVADGAIPWCEPVKRALKDHICKQVATVIMEWLTPSFEIQSVRMRASFENKPADPLPGDVSSALNIFRHELVERFRDRYYRRDKETEKEWDGAARQLVKRVRERLKHRGLYVELRSDGSPKEHKVTEAEASREIGRAKTLEDAGGTILSFNEHREIKESLRWMFFDIEHEESKAELARLQQDSTATSEQRQAATLRMANAEARWRAVHRKPGNEEG